MFYFEPTWSDLIQFEPILSDLNQFKLIWTNVNQCEPMWTTVNQFDPIWTNLSCFNQIITLMQFEAILSDLNFQKWDKQTQTWQRLRSFKQDCLSLKTKKTSQNITKHHKTYYWKHQPYAHAQKYHLFDNSRWKYCRWIPAFRTKKFGGE